MHANKTGIVAQRRGDRVADGPATPIGHTSDGAALLARQPRNVGFLSASRDRWIQVLPLPLALHGFYTDMFDETLAFLCMRDASRAANQGLKQTVNEPHRRRAGSFL